MTDKREPIHPHGLAAEQLAWLNQQDKAMLVEIIGQLCWAMLVARPLLDEAILRAHRNRLQRAVDLAYRRVEVFGVPPLNTPEPERSQAWNRMDRLEDFWRRAQQALDASWYLKPGFHRGVK